MKQLFAYIRVSTAKQGQGVSLQEQRASIERFAARVGAEIIEWFEERKTAAKTGRPEFVRMMRMLRQGKASGVVIHKIDRSTRNYRDWADIDELIDSGIDVHFANDDLDLRSRGGRLAADIQVAMAVDYIRNLREETLKGIHGRLKQGILPTGVGIGYLNAGAGKPKLIDPKQGPMVKRIFELYGSGAYTLRDLTGKAADMGLRNRCGNAVRIQEIHKILRNPFYAGTIRSKRFGLFPGAHVPLISHALFDRVQDVLEGRFVRRTRRHDFQLRRFMRCKTCGRCLIGSIAKGNVYYRCPTISCPTTSIREDRAEEVIRHVLRAITLGAEEAELVETELAALSIDDATLRKTRRTSLTEALSVLNARLSRLTDLLLDEKVGTHEHDERRATLLAEKIRLEQDLAEADAADLSATAQKIVELAKRPEILYETASTAQKRQLLEIVMSNCVATGKNLEFAIREPFATIASRHSGQSCRPQWDTDRTFAREELLSWGKDWPEKLLRALHEGGIGRTSAPAA
ncbi:MAG TPA: recombinase family protein [Gemmatimonadaceae bacterium]|jgi:DNA invertase Pin-like site-specific DNA recombinase|nr:recombinase family protein [Gemmatimonadaceae bacterium]